LGFYNLLVELKVFIESTLLIGAEGTKTPAGVRGRGDPTGAKRRGGSPARPRKAKCLERQSTDLFKSLYTIIPNYRGELLKQMNKIRGSRELFDSLKGEP